MGEVVQINQRGISPAIIQWFQNRGISQQTLTSTKVYSTVQRRNGADQQIVVFPFISDGKIVGRKFRDSAKNIWQETGSEQIFWNNDIIDHPDLQSGKQSLVITEGEPDALSFIEAGYPFTVSVPNGAPPASNEPVFIPEEDTKFAFVQKAWQRLKNIKRIILAVDNDAPGKRLLKELAMRLGEARCLTVNYPEGCKDANDVLVKYGVEAVYDLIAAPIPYPISGLYKVSELPPEPAVEPMTTGWGRLDEYLMVYTPCFMVVTGKPNEGKSTWTTQLVAQLAIHHGWNITISSFEMMIKPFVTDALTSVYRDLSPHGNPEQWLHDHFNFIIPRSDDDTDSLFDIDWLLERAAAASVRYKSKVLLIDPWNELDHTFSKHESHTDYVGRAIRSIKRFARDHDMLVIVVAHPTKTASEKKKASEIDLFDIADSAHFHNKADLGAVIARIENSYESNVFIKKVRYQPRFGRRGMVPLTFSPHTGTFSQ